MFNLSSVWKLLHGSGERRMTKFSVKSRPRPAKSRLFLESLEERTLLSLSFGPPVTLPVGVGPMAIVTADLNNDGKQDIVVLNQGLPFGSTSSVSALLGKGDGTFQPAVTTNLLAGARSVAAGDFNGDGKADLAIANDSQNVVEVLRGNGDGAFQSNHLTLTASGRPPSSSATSATTARSIWRSRIQASPW